MRDSFVKTLYWKINSCIFLLKNPLTLPFKGIVYRDSIVIKFCEVTSVHYWVPWCFALNGQCHKIFCFKFFSWIIFPKASENPQICGLTKFLTFVDLPHMRQFADLRFGDRIFFAICGFADPNLLRTYNLCKSVNSLFFCLQIHT